MPTALESLVRRADEDRWLASRFAPAPVRAKLTALYAVNYEIARTGEVVREAALGDIRLHWWRDALAEIAGGAAPREHPALRALAGAFPQAAGPLQALADARRADLDPAPFQTWEDVERYLDATAGALMRLAIEACAPEASAALAHVVQPAARAWGFIGLTRSAQFWQARGRSIYPREERARETMLMRAEAAHAAARAAPAPPAAAFPALGYVALAPAYLRALRSGKSEPSVFARQLRLIAAAASGRL
ncbi:MAG: squalene/phytoene synthase family protein [Vitreimonas sp.]